MWQAAGLHNEPWAAFLLRTQGSVLQPRPSLGLLPAACRNRKMGCGSLGFPPLPESFLRFVCYPTHPRPKLNSCNLSAQPLLGTALGKVTSQALLVLLCSVCAPAPAPGGSRVRAALTGGLHGSGGQVATPKSCVAGCVPVQEGLTCALVWPGLGLEKLPHFPVIWGRRQTGCGAVCIRVLCSSLFSKKSFGGRPGAAGGQPCLASSP